MGFFDDALNKTKEALDVAYKKTGEVINTERQKFDVASIKSKRDKDFTALGKIYFETVCDDGNLNDEVKALVEAIKEKTEEINRINAEIQNAKNKRICPNCNANIAEDSVYCNACGVKLTIDSED